ncbi:MAG: glutamate-5-semialdehyde dehydrogenase [Hyperionvirus sp.]|uniref:glutamate-5-semialdehyde dehydrogenase n=1 Tax=Hyperionvirus sp. TaxID=2487770 RepID=A0A3G5A657_9VIRU|nr:MAG: glutamate-5-semialdehyde dehydrogenase [Hyperionvirus sp.]
MNNVRAAAGFLANLSNDQKNDILTSISNALERDAEVISKANELDRADLLIPKVLRDRLVLDRKKLANVISGIGDIIKMSDPVGVETIDRDIYPSLRLKRVSYPIGVIAVIFESRPDVFIQIVSLAIKSGNAVILKCGKEAINTCKQLHQTILNAHPQIPPDGIQLLTTREATNDLLKMDKHIDLIIPRGSKELINYVKSNTKIPVIGHSDGICHIYVESAPKIAVDIIVDSKVQNPSACNSVETVLIHSSIADTFIPALAQRLKAHSVQLRGDLRTQQIHPMQNIIDWSTEYCDLIISIKIVDSLDEAISHINNYGSHHTDAIISEDSDSVNKFFKNVDSANVFNNCSTRLSDGYRYGFGAEIGISTQKQPPRGPVALEGLITYKYQLTNPTQQKFDL